MFRTERRPRASTPRTRVLLSLVVAVVAVLGLLGAGVAEAHTGQGHATPGNEGPHPWATDGCSTPGININSVRGVFNFKHACEHHDGCYKGFPRNNRPTYWVSRWQCDAWFLYDMQASCTWQHGPNMQVSRASRDCQQWASNYHWAVRTHARGAYKGPINN